MGRKRFEDKTPPSLYREKILNDIFVECYVERLLELNLWSFWKVVLILCRFVTGQVRSKCDLLYYSSENVLFDLCWPFLTNEKTKRFLTLDSCRGYFFFHMHRRFLPKAHMCVQSVCKRILFQLLSLRPAGTYYLHLWPQWDHRCPDAFSPQSGIDCCSNMNWN